MRAGLAERARVIPGPLCVGASVQMGMRERQAHGGPGPTLSTSPLLASRFSLLALALAGRSPRFPRVPSGAAGGRGSARRGAGREAGDVRDSAGMHCPRTPADSRGPSAQGCAGGADAGWPFSCLLLFGHTKRSRSGRPKDGPKALALRFQRRSDETEPRQAWSSWWARAHPMTAARSGSSKGWPKALAPRFRQPSEQTKPGRVRSSWWARAHPMTAPRSGSPQG